MKALVTGGNGFLGTALCRMLREEGHEVRSLSRRAAPHLADLGVLSLQGDVADVRRVREAARGVDVVFHVAAKAGIWGRTEDFERSNVQGTKAVLAACREEGVRKLVHTSSPSVVASGADLSGVDESTPYPAHYVADYPRTKAEAEILVLAANGPDLSTTALRPHLIWGPDDPQLTARLVARAKAGKLRLIGSGKQRVDTTYVENAALAHVLAARALGPGSANAGRPYFVSNGEPWPIDEIVAAIVACAGAPPPRGRVPYPVAWLVGAASEVAYRLLSREDEPLMTRFLAEELATAHWFDVGAARRDFGYVPRVSIAEGLVRLRASFGG